KLLELLRGEPRAAARVEQRVRPVAGQLLARFREPVELFEVVLEPLPLHVVEQHPGFGALLTAARPADVPRPRPPPPFLAPRELRDVLDEPEAGQLPQVVA